MATTFAQVSDLEARWRPLSTEETATATVLLEDASVQLRAEFPLLEAQANTSLDIAKAAVRVACAMVKRAMAAGEDAIGIASTQETTGPFSRSLNFTNPMGDLYITRSEKRLLGGARQSAFTVDTLPAPVDPVDVILGILP